MSDEKERITIQLVSTETLLVLIFLTLKLTGCIAWSWWWIFAPYWIGLAIVVAFLLLLGIIGIFAIMITYLIDKFQK